MAWKFEKAEAVPFSDEMRVGYDNGESRGSFLVSRGFEGDFDDLSEEQKIAYANGKLALGAAPQQATLFPSIGALPQGDGTGSQY